MIFCSRIMRTAISLSILSLFLLNCSKETPDPELKSDVQHETAVKPDSLSTVLSTAPKPKRTAFSKIKSLDQFKQVVESAGDQLIVFELYADWCMPCRILEPILKQLAVKHKDKALFYKVDIDRLPQIARSFGARGIPFVAFVKNRKTVKSFAGIRQKQDYEQALEKWGIKAPKQVAKGDSTVGG